MKNCLIILILFGIISCTKGQYVPPGERILSEETMMNILIDFHVAEAGVQEGRIKSDTTTKHISIYYDHIYKLYDVKKKDFEKTFQYYISHPNEFDALYEKINEQMKREEEILKKKITDNRNAKKK